MFFSESQNEQQDSPVLQEVKEIDCQLQQFKALYEKLEKLAPNIEEESTFKKGLSYLNQKNNSLEGILNGLNTKYSLILRILNKSSLGSHRKLSDIPTNIKINSLVTKFLNHDIGTIEKIQILGKQIKELEEKNDIDKLITKDRYKIAKNALARFENNLESANETIVKIKCIIHGLTTNLIFESMDGECSSDQELPHLDAPPRLR